MCLFLFCAKVPGGCLQKFFWRCLEMKSINTLLTPPNRRWILLTQDLMGNQYVCKWCQRYYYARLKNRQRELAFISCSTPLLCFILKQSHKYPSSNSQKNSAAAPRSLRTSRRLFHNSSNSQWAAKRNRSKKNLPSQSECAVCRDGAHLFYPVCV